MFKIKLLLLFLFIGVGLIAQETFPTDGAPNNRSGKYAFTNATIFKSYNQKIEKATLLIEKGKVVAVGSNIKISKGTVVKDLKGKYIYPSFIETISGYGLPDPKSVGERPRQQPQSLSNKKGAYSWNEAIKPEWNAAEHFKIDEASAKELRKLGFGTIMIHSMDGISRGTGAAVTLGNSSEQEQLLQEKSAHIFSFSKGKSTQNYPSSQMGSIALIRQTFLDGKWYANTGKNKERNLSLEAWNEVQKFPQIFVTSDRLEILRAAKIGEEFNKEFIFQGSGDEYKRLPEIKQVAKSIIVPINFPAPLDVEDPYDAQLVELQELKHWELAPTNPGRLVNSGLEIAITTDGLKKKTSFHKKLRDAIEGGLSEEEALKALTFNPASIIGLDKKVGTLEPGKLANFFISSDNIFKKETKIYQNWIQGEEFKVIAFPEESLEGKYSLKVNRAVYDIEVKDKDGKPTAKIIVNDSTSTKLNILHSKGQLTLSFTPEGQTKKIRLAGTMDGKNWSGRGQGQDGTWMNWQAKYLGPLDADEDKKKTTSEEEQEVEEELSSTTFPFLPYGWTEKPKQESILIKGATIWTNESEGILEDADVLFSNGKIVAVGKGIKAPAGAVIINGEGKHVTSGIIDEHSHIAISKGVNEGSQASSAEVSIATVINSEDINIYRQLAGGVTAAQLLHGSANPIGGQSGLIKFRWGLNPDEMKIKGADGFIKFALGENVKQSNWGDHNRTRFPQTRMGVEQVFVDHFDRAKEYTSLKKSGKPFRKDLELEALQEILESKRFITCHSYRQSEINMLMKVAERFDFRINTFTHILEGYKVAEKMKNHGVGGSAFSDWWAYKYEVDEATPYNGSIMHKQGVIVAYNSDDAEMARRLNQEAAKAVKYGGVSEEEAWKFVTLNPAKLLHLDNRMGSVKKGKDADLVLWSEKPLSVYAKAEITWVDGIRYFDREKDILLQKEIAQERSRLIQKMLNQKSKGKKTEPVKLKVEHYYNCESLEHSFDGQTFHQH